MTFVMYFHNSVIYENNFHSRCFSEIAAAIRFLDARAVS